MPNHVAQHAHQHHHQPITRIRPLVFTRPIVISLDWISTSCWIFSTRWFAVINSAVEILDALISITILVLEGELATWNRLQDRLEHGRHLLQPLLELLVDIFLAGPVDLVPWFHCVLAWMSTSVAFSVVSFKWIGNNIQGCGWGSYEGLRLVVRYNFMIYVLVNFICITE